jgi:lysozyme
MIDREGIRNRLILEEGLELFPYKCTAGKTTIGVGRNIEERGISHEAAMIMLDEDIDICVEELRKNLSWFDDAPVQIKGVLIDLAFNMGINRLLGFVQTLKHLREGDYAAAATELLDSRYAQMLPQRSQRNAALIMGAATDG